jgi:hypothetical protein
MNRGWGLLRVTPDPAQADAATPLKIFANLVLNMAFVDAVSK